MSRYHRQSGFGLTESLIALVILSVGLLALNGVHTQFIRSLSEENNRSQALMLTSKRLDEFRMDAADKTFNALDGSKKNAYETSLDQEWTVSGSNPATVTVTTSWSEDASDSVTLSALISELTPVTLSFQGQEVGSGGGSSSSPSNESPVATDDAADVTQNQSGSNNSVEINVKVNDSDAETANENLGVSQSTTTSNGVLTLTDGVFTYTPNDDFIGSDAFTYLLSDGDGGVDSATVTITVLALSGNNPPIAVGDTGSVTEDSGSYVITINLLANDSDPDGDDINITGINGAAIYGTRALINGSFTYTLDNGNSDVNGLNSGQTLTEIFTYTLSDGTDTVAGNITITIQGANDYIGTYSIKLTNKTSDDKLDISKDYLLEYPLGDGSITCNIVSSNYNNVDVGASITLSNICTVDSGTLSVDDVIKIKTDKGVHIYNAIVTQVLLGDRVIEADITELPNP